MSGFTRTLVPATRDDRRLQRLPEAASSPPAGRVDDEGADQGGRDRHAAHRGRRPARPHRRRRGSGPALAFLKQLQDGSGLLLERELDTWAFAHLSFQEFLCADEWVSRPENAPTDWDRKVSASWWRETILLYHDSIELRPERRGDQDP